MDPSPTVGRIVHYHRDEDADPEPAIVTRVRTTKALGAGDAVVDSLDLTVFPPGGTPWPAIAIVSVHADSLPLGDAGRWSWPPRA